MDAARRTTRSKLGIGRLFDTVRDAIVIADAETGKIALWNPAAARLLGWAADEIEGKPLETIIPRRYRERHRAGIERYRATGRGSLIDTQDPVLLPALHKDGSEIEIELMLSPLESEHGRHAIAIIRDVTERRRREEDLRRANEDLEAFGYAVSHDLKEPVRALMYYLDALVEDHGDALPPEARELLERARGANERLRRHLERLLEYSRASRADLARAPLAVAELLRMESCQALYGRLAEERGATLLFEAAGPRVLGNAETLCQALGNLVANSIKHNDAKPPVVRVRVEESGEEATVFVEDNGNGFPPSVLAAFAKGGVVPGAGPHGGFGLAIARRAMDRQGGRMAIENRPEGGAVVRLTLPVAH